ncbi:DUF4352 domain-containing protein [Corynebacteriaceae bacterium 7-707]
MKPRHTITALALTVPLVLAACGNDDSGEDGDNGEGTSATATTSGDRDGTTGTDSDLPRIGETLSVDKADITVTDLREHDHDPTNQICADVNFTVTSDTEPLKVRGLAAWKLYDPEQLPRTQTVSEETDHVLDEVGPGQSEDGTICFDGPADPGEYRLSFQEDFDARTDRVEWVGTL